MKKNVSQSGPSNEDQSIQRNIIKTRDDIHPVHFLRKDGTENKEKGMAYSLESDEDRCSWISFPDSFYE